MARKLNNNNNEKVCAEPYAGFIKQCKFNRYIIFYVVLILHFFWGWSILWADKPLRQSPPLKHLFDDIHSTHFVAWIFIAASLIALYAITRDFKNSFTKVLFLLPQQTLLLWTCFSAIAVSHSISSFLTELPLTVITTTHSVALLYNFVFIPVIFKKK